MRSRIRASRSVAPTIGDVGATVTSSRRNSMSRSCITTSRNSVTCGCNTNAAMRAPPMLCGLTTRSAPPRRSFSKLSSMRTRATMKRSGRRAACAEGDEEVAGVGVERGHQRPRPVESGTAQHVVVGRVTDDDRVRATSRDATASRSIDDRCRTGVGDVLGDRPTDAPPPADDDGLVACLRSCAPCAASRRRRAGRPRRGSGSGRRGRSTAVPTPNEDQHDGEHDARVSRRVAPRGSRRS